MTFLQLVTLSAIVTLAAYGVVSWLQRREARRLEDFQALAARRGWSLTHAEQSLGRPPILRLSARSGPGWQAESRQTSAAGEQSKQRRITEWACDEPRWREGTLVIGPAMPGGDTAIAAQLLGRLDSRQGRQMMQRLTGGRLGFEASGLRVIEGPELLTVLATSDPRRRVDLGDLAKVLAAWEPARTGEEGHPILVLSPEGMRMRLRHDTRDAEQMEAFIDLALATVRTIG